MTRLLFRLSLRDLRRHWVAVVAIALVIAIGTGVFAGLRGTSAWRLESNDRSFAQTAIHDLRAELSAGTYVDEGALLRALGGIASANAVTAATERLVVANQIDASTADETILVQARLVGMPFDEPGSRAFVDALWLRDGALPGGSLGEVVLEAKFADFYDLPPQGGATMAGGRTVDYVGLGVGPEDFWVTGADGSIFAQGDFALVYSTIETAQWLADRPGQVNDVVLTLAPGTDRRLVETELREALDAIPGVSATVTDRDDVESFSVLYDDIENDEQVWTMISILVLLAAALAAFNLVSRIVEAQRREIGIGMALGVSRRRLAIRPLMVGAQIGLVGTAAGVGVGVLLGWLMKGLFESFLPLPEWRTPFQFGVYAWAAVLGFGIPVVAAAIPVWRAVRVEPIEAIRTGHLTARSSRFTDWTNRVRLPGSSLSSMPVRNVLRTPRRTLLTAVGVGAAITALVAVLGMLDSFSRSIERGGAEVTKGDPDRVLVTLDTFYRDDDPAVLAVGDADAVGRADAGLRIGAVALDPDDSDDDIDLLLELLDVDAAAWTPTIVEGTNGDGGLVLARKAADDLGVGPGDTVSIRHLALGPDGPFQDVSELRVDGIHPNPIRNFAYGDLALAEQFGLGGLVNLVHAYPGAEAGRGDVQAAVFDLEGVTSAQAVARFAEIFDEAIEQFAPVLYVTAGFVLALAILIAFNSSRITVEERRREHATMRAFGLPVRSVMGVVVKESVLVGVFATAIGLATGTLILGWMLTSLAENSLPDLGISVHLAPQTLIIALVVGVIAVAVAPLFLIRSLRRMNVPDTLRVME